MNEHLSFGRWLRRLRIDADMTQDRLAERVGCAGQTIRMFESDARRPSRDLAERLADVLHVGEERESFVRRARIRQAEPPTRAEGERVAAPTASAAEPPAPAPRPALVALPHAPNALIGRQQEHESIRAALLDPSRRLVTLLGPGGIGKSRLALQLANDLLPQFLDGVVWVSLATLTQPAEVVVAVAGALGVTLQGVDAPTEQVVRHLWERRMLVVLDNFEHLLGAVDLLSAILAQAPTVQLLVTSRERLRMAGEWTVELGGLQLPPNAQYQAVLRAPSVLLFVERARQIDQSFALTPVNGAAVARICQLLEGIPLAIELAVAWIRVLTPDEIALEITRSLDFLESSERNVSGRHASLRAVFDHSLRLLGDGERRAFQNLAVFRGGWGRQAASEIADASLRTLAELVDKSLVVAEHGLEHGLRYRLLEPIRQYLIEGWGDAQAFGALEARHAAWFVALAEQAGPEIRGPQQSQWLERLDLDHDNLRAAMDWALRTGAYDDAGRLGWALHLFWWIRGYQDEGQRAMQQLLQSATLELLPRARALCVLGIMLYGNASASAAQRFYESADLFREMGDVPGEAYAIAGAGLMALQIGDAERARRDLEQSLSLHTQLNDTWMVTQLSTYLGLLFLQQGDFAQAARYHQDARTQAERVHDQWGMCLATYNLATLAQAQAQDEEALRLFRDAMTLAQNVGNEATVAYCVQGIAALASKQCDSERAARLYGAAAMLLERVGQPLYAHMPDPRAVEQTIATLRNRLDPQVFNRAWAEGRALSLQDTLSAALSG